MLATLLRSLTILGFLVLIISGTQVVFAQQANELQAQASELLKSYKPPEMSAPTPTATPQQSWSDFHAGQRLKRKSTAATSPLRVNTMPSYSVSLTYANALAGQGLSVWGNVSGGSGVYTYRLDYGDGSYDSGAVANPHFIGSTHTYSLAGTRTMKLQVWDDLGATQVDSSRIRVFASPTQEIRVNMAIELGLLYLYQNQYSSGYWYDASSYQAGTGAALLCFEENGHRATNNIDSDIYAEFVKLGLDYLFSNASSFSIYPQSAGDPDVNGDGLGAYIDPSTYANGIANLAVLAAHTDTLQMQADTIRVGALSGWTYYRYVRNMVDQWAFSQTEGSAPSRGGWRYYVNTPNYGDQDNSTTQWGALNLFGAEKLGILAPAWVKSELLVSLGATQGPSGGFGYNDNYGWLNVTKTAAAIGSYVYTGATTSSPAIDTAIGFMNAHWTDAYDNSSWTGPFNGNTYALYGVSKGMRIINGGAGNQYIRSHDWYAEFVSHLLDNPTWKQNSNGSWPRNASYYPTSAMGDPLNSSFALLVLTRGVLVQPPVAVIDPISSKPSNTAFYVSGANSYHQDPNKHIVQYLWDWDASNGVNWNSPDATGPTPLNPGYPSTGTYTITLRVVDDGEAIMTSDVTTTVEINDTSNHPPIAVAIPPGGAAAYAGHVGEPILLDGSFSHDPDAPQDSVVGYNWDTNGDGNYGDAFTPQATVTFNSEYNGQVGLRVYDTHGDSSTNNAYITIVASRKDLSVLSFTATPYYTHAGDSIRLFAVLKNNDSSNADVAGVLVRFFDENPLTTGNQLGGTYTVDLPIGTSDTVDTKVALPSLPYGTRNLYVYLDPNHQVDEWNEENNLSSAEINIGAWLTLRGMKFNDLNQNGTRDEGEPGIPGWYIYCDRERSTSTGQDGTYEFTGIPAGNHTVSEGLDTDWVQTYPPEGEYAIFAETDSVITGLDFGNYQKPSTGISGLKFHDVNGNGAKDSGEPGLAGWSIVATGAVAETTVTDSNGAYQLFLKNSGTYVVSEVPQAGWVQTASAPDTVQYTVGTWVNDVNFGNFKLGSISGTKFFDRDSSGTKNDVSEGPLAGVKIVLYGTHVAPDTVVTDSNGVFTFSNLMADTYTLTEALKAEWRQTYPAGGAAYTVPILSGVDTTGFVFGNFHLLDTGKFRTFLLSDYHKASIAKQKSGYIRNPNAGNVRDDVFLRRGFSLDIPSDSGYLRLGVKRYDSALVYGWFWHTWRTYKKPAVTHWIYNLPDWGTKRDPKTKTQIPRSPANYLGILGEISTETYFGNAGNHLTMELTTLKTNIAASDLQITPQGFGDLLYLTRTATADTVFNHKSLRQIALLADTALTMGRKIIRTSETAIETTYRCSKTYLYLLDSVIARVNREFRSSATKLDTISTKPLMLRGVKALYKVTYLVRDSAHSIPLAHFEPNYAAEEAVPSEYRLEQNYPNPFNPATTIQFELMAASNVTLKIYNILGQEVQAIFDNQSMEAGVQTIEVDASNLASGIYFYRLEANGVDEQGVKHSFTNVKKMMLMK